MTDLNVLHALAKYPSLLSLNDLTTHIAVESHLAVGSTNPILVFRDGTVALGNPCPLFFMRPDIGYFDLASELLMIGYKLGCNTYCQAELEEVIARAEAFRDIIAESHQQLSSQIAINKDSLCMV